MSIDVHKDMNENALLIGRVTMQWTAVQAAISHLFRRVSGLDMARAEAIFFAIKSDASQREMTLAAARVVFAGHPDLLERAERLFERVGRLSGERNAVAHTIWAVKMPEGRVTPYPTKKHHPRLKISDHRTQFERLLGELVEVFRDAVQLDKDAGERLIPSQHHQVAPQRGSERDRQEGHVAPKRGGRNAEDR